MDYDVLKLANSLRACTVHASVRSASASTAPENDLASSSWAVDVGDEMTDVQYVLEFVTCTGM